MDLSQISHEINSFFLFPWVAMKPELNIDKTQLNSSNPLKTIQEQL